MSSEEEDCIGFNRKKIPIIESSDDEDDGGVPNESASLLESPRLEHAEALHASLENSENLEETSTSNLKKIACLKSRLLTSSDVESDFEPEEKFESEPSNEDIPEHYSESCPVELKKDLNKSRSGKKLIKDQRLLIRSETQRLEREKVLDLPYHRPKQRTLGEFLRRKKNTIKAEALRSTSASMISVWEEIDKSTKEAVEFFKSESESEEDIEPEPEQPPKDEKSLADDEKNEHLHSLVDNCTPKQNENKMNPEESPPVMPQKSEEVVGPKEMNTVNENSFEQSMQSSLPHEALNLRSPSSEEKTLKWLKDISNQEKRESLKAKLQLSPSVLNKVPKLSMDGDFIEFDEPKPHELKEGAKRLMEQFLEGRRRKTRGPTILKTTVAERDGTGAIKNLSSESVIINESALNSSDPGFCKPGEKYKKLKEKLRLEIEAKWEEQFKKKMAEVKPKEDFEEVTSEIEEVDDTSEGETESEPEEEDVEIRDEPRKTCPFGDSEVEESENDDGVDGDIEEGDDDDNDEEIEELVPEKSNKEIDSVPASPPNHASGDLECSLIPAFQPGGGLLMGGSTLTQQTQPLPFNVNSPVTSPAVGYKTPRTPKSQDGPSRSETTPLAANRNEPVEPTSIGAKKNLFGLLENKFSQGQTAVNSVDDTEDPYFFVSGAFPETQDEQGTGIVLPESTVDEGASSLVNTSASHSCNSKTKILKRIVVADDSEESRGSEPGSAMLDENVNKDTVPLKMLDDENDDELQISKKSQKKPLTFSDDEEHDNELNEMSDGEESENFEETAENLDHEDVEYDSEENEVVAAKPTDFFEQEAELSESEWSGDEDERGLDRLEAEAGDADILDENQVASQLGRIHMRRLMDEDARDVRLLQELLFEDGDLHSDGKGRDRQFRWKNMDGGFDMLGAQTRDAGSDGEEENDAEVAKMRHEKAQFLLKVEQDGKLDLIEDSLSSKDDPLKLGQQLLQKLKNRPILQSRISGTRGSLLKIGEDYLSRLAKVVTSSSPSDGPLGPSHSKNFVFAAQDKEVESVTVVKQSIKRKALKCHDSVKRVKLVASIDSERSYLDQLL